MNKTNQDRIDAYLHGRMPSKDIPAFEKDLENDEELRQQLFFSQNLQYVIKSRNDKLNTMKRWEEDYKWKNNGDRVTIHSSRRPFFYYITSIAAVLIICVFFFGKLLTSNKTNDASNIGITEKTYRDEDNSDILYMIEHKKYQEAIIIIKDRSHALERASMEYQIDDTEKDGIDKFNKKVKDKQDELKWLEIQILPSLDREDAALNLLDELRKTDGNYQLLADSLYRHMKK